MPTQTTDITGNPIALQYTAANQTWIIAAGVKVTGSILSSFASSALVNQGDIATTAIAVAFAPAGANGSYSVVNKATGDISGGIAISDFQGSLEILNDGAIHASILFGVVTGGSGNINVENTGTIDGDEGGLSFNVSLGALGPRVTNSGRIDGGTTGIFVTGAVPVAAKIVNRDGAVIEGDAAAVLSTLKLDMTNEGRVNGRIVLAGNTDDKIVNKAKIAGDIDFGAGSDSFANKGAGRAGLINTGTGNDVVSLGDKADKLLFDTALNATTNLDTIKKFATKDKIFLDDDIFSVLTPGMLSSAAFRKGKAAADANDRIIYDKASGGLFYDADGKGGVEQTQFAELVGGPKLKASNFIAGEYSLIVE